MRRPSQLYQKGLMNEKNVMIDDKLISSKLDEYRAKYDLNKYMYEIKNKKTLDQDKKELINFTPNPKSRDSDYRQFLRTKTQNDKEHVLRSSIYYNLISEDDNKDKSNFKFRNTFIRKKLSPINTKSGAFLKPILYGMPTHAAFELAEKGHFILGGCCIEENAPKWLCPKCGNMF